MKQVYFFFAAWVTLSTVSCGNNSYWGLKDLVSPVENGRMEVNPTAQYSNGQFSISGRISFTEPVPAGYFANLSVNSGGKGSSGRTERTLSEIRELTYQINNLTPGVYRVWLEADKEFEKVFSSPEFIGFYSGQSKQHVRESRDALLIQITDQSLPSVDFVVGRR